MKAEKNSIDNWMRKCEELKTSQINNPPVEFSFDFKHPLHEVMSVFTLDLFVDEH